MTIHKKLPAEAPPEGEGTLHPAASSDQGGLAYLLLVQEVHEFLCAEADLLDERRYDEWLDLLDDDVAYWVPMRRNV